MLFFSNTDDFMRSKYKVYNHLYIVYLYSIEQNH